MEQEGERMIVGTILIGGALLFFILIMVEAWRRG